MRAVLQRVLNGKVDISGDTVSKIGKGIVVLVAVNNTDNIDTFKYMADKIINLRIFEDEDEKLNLSVKDLDFEILIVPNFTVYADVRKGRRPSFVGGAKPDDADRYLKTLLSM